MEGFKWGLMKHPSKNIEGIGTKGNLIHVDLAQHVSEQKNFSICSRDCSCDTG